MSMIEENDDYNPYEHRKLKHPTSNLDTLMHLIKGALGSGILSIPLAFKNSGLWMGFILIWFTGFLVTHGLYLVIKCSHIVCRRKKIPSLNYAETAESIFLTGPKKLRKYSLFIKRLINILLFIDLFGSCCVNVVFVGKNIGQFVEFYSDNYIDTRWIMLILYLPLTCINLLGKLKWLAPFSTIANILLFSGFVILMTYMTKDVPKTIHRPFIEAGLGVPLFFAAVLFAISCVGVIMALENNMKNPTQLIGCPGVLYVGMFIVTALNCVTGFMGFLKYGDNIKESVTLNLPMDEALAQSVKIMMAMAVTCTHALQFYVPMEIILEIAYRKSNWNRKVLNYGLRALLVGGTVLIAICVPNLLSLMSLIGAFSLCNLGFLIPAILELMLYYDVPNGFGRFHWRLWKNICMILISLFGCIVGGYSSLVELTFSYQKSRI